MPNSDHETVLELPGRLADVLVHCGGEKSGGTPGAGGNPCVTRCYPLRIRRSQVEPFPTLYWLSCPSLSRQLSHLERDGAIGVIERELASNQPMRDKLARQHQQYIDARWQQISSHDRELIAQRGWENNFQTRGIAGTQKWTTVKCLHAHYAHHLVDDNVIGLWIDQHYEIAACTGR